MEGKAVIYKRWTGLGCLSPVLGIAIICASVYGGAILARGGGIFAAILVGTGLMVLLTPLHWLFGFALNSKRKPLGR